MFLTFATHVTTSPCAAPSSEVEKTPYASRGVAQHAATDASVFGGSGASAATTCHRLGTGLCAERSGCVLSQLFSAPHSTLDASDPCEFLWMQRPLHP